jgi:hypothetical protein
VEERERGRKEAFGWSCHRWGKEKGRQDKGEERRKTDGISQRLMRNFKKLQGPFCKA